MQPDQRIEHEQTRLACLDGIGEALPVRWCIQAERRVVITWTGRDWKF